jgi:hypothetical protein
MRAEAEREVPVCRMILDGRNRYAACRRAGVEPVTKPWDGRGEPYEFVASLNLHRRHLDTSQRAMIAIRMAELRGRPKGSQNHADGESAPKAALSQPVVAEILNVSRGSVQRASQVLEHGTPGEIRAVDDGRTSVTTLAFL